jgi:hypothetical protein
MEKCCRICQDPDTNTSELIVPCKCKGTIKYVHRHCLDEWRLTYTNFSYYKCPNCLYDYTIEDLNPENSWYKYLYKALIFLESLSAIVIVQLLLIGLSTLIYNLDTEREFENDYCSFIKNEKVCYYFVTYIIIAIAFIIALLFFVVVLMASGSSGNSNIIIINNNNSSALVMSKGCVIFTSIITFFIGFIIIIVMSGLLVSLFIEKTLAQYGKYKLQKMSRVKNIEETDTATLV